MFEKKNIKTTSVNNFDIKFPDISFSQTQKIEHLKYDCQECLLCCDYNYYYSTVEPWYNEPLFHELLGITNNFLYPSNSQIYGKEPR